MRPLSSPQAPLGPHSMAPSPQCGWSQPCTPNSPELLSGQPEPQPGDLLEFDRAGYKHWGVYVGEDEPGLLDPFWRFLGFTRPKCVVHVAKTPLGVEVQKEPLEVVGAGARYRVRNLHNGELQAFPQREIMARARRQLGQPFPYDLVEQNCQHFATCVRYDVARSAQVERVKGIAWALLDMFEALWSRE
ncbi:phospholipase A and acyltransferase 2 isoform X2 [Alligator mississippiensis]|uniref:phospholipase A and acyltransferase 2 isoform X2 n=1 Tax=Alligator mississippiensis TaxID=8496 RepID=UPI0028775C55|nr:phospholipase A and acyltransferase 2 isoform X2 [Alligator mississippiensis]